MSGKGWIGVDLDGTLAFYDKWRGIEHVGEPIPKMLRRVKNWIASGQPVKIFTARCGEPTAIPYIEAWLDEHGIGGLEVTNVKDFAMIELWDDRAIQVTPNTGEALAEGIAGLLDKIKGLEGRIAQSIKARKKK